MRMKAKECQCRSLAYFFAKKLCSETIAFHHTISNTASMDISHFRNAMNQNHTNAMINHRISFKLTFSFNRIIHIRKVNITSLLLSSHIGHTHPSFIAVAQHVHHIAHANQMNIKIFQWFVIVFKILPLFFLLKAKNGHVRITDPIIQ